MAPVLSVEKIFSEGTGKSLKSQCALESILLKSQSFDSHNHWIQPTPPTSPAGTKLSNGSLKEKMLFQSELSQPTLPTSPTGPKLPNRSPKEKMLFQRQLSCNSPRGQSPAREETRRGSILKSAAAHVLSNEEKEHSAFTKVSSKRRKLEKARKEDAWFQSLQDVKDLVAKDSQRGKSPNSSKPHG